MDLSPQEKERLERRRQLIRRVMIFIICVFLLFLILSYMPFYRIWRILEGGIVSTQLDENSLHYKGKTIIFTNNTYDQLKELYLENQRTEFSVCLQGYNEGNASFITRLAQPRTASRSVFEVVSEICDAKTVVALHTHPYKSCIFSQEDIEYYLAFRERNPEGFIALMCELDRFTIHRK